MPNLDELYPQIRRLIPLHLLPHVVCQCLCQELTPEEAITGDTLFERGSQDADWIFVLEGEVCLEADGIVLDRIEGGSEAARFPLAHHVPRKVAARALTPLKYIRLDHKRLRLMEHTQQDLLESDHRTGEESSGDWLTKLFKSPVFQRLPASNLHKIVQRFKAVEVRKGEKVIAQEEVGECIYILRSGRAQVTRRPRPNAREIKLGQLKPGDLFGDDALLSGQPQAVDVTMLTDGIVQRLDKEDFLLLVVEPVLKKLDFNSARCEVEQGAAWLDVRDPERFKYRRVDGSLNIPFFSLRMQLASFDRQRKYILVCDDGGESAAAAFLLLRFGFEAAVLAGGLTSVPPGFLVGEGAWIGAESRIPHKEPEGVASVEQQATADPILKLEQIQEVQDLWVEIERLQTENQALRRKLEEADRVAQTSRGVQQELEELQRQKQALEAEVGALHLRVAELEEVIRQYCEAVQAEGAGESIQALQAELAMVREQADRDVAAMRQEAEEARQECKRLRAQLNERGLKALPPELIAVEAEQLPLHVPEVEIPKSSLGDRALSVLWVLVGLLISVATLGIGLQTESGRHFALTWLGESEVSVGATPAAPTDSQPQILPLPVQSQDTGAAGDLFAQ